MAVWESAAGKIFDLFMSLKGTLDEMSVFRRQAGTVCVSFGRGRMWRLREARGASSTHK